MIFFYEESKSKKKIFFCCFLGGGCGGVGGLGRIDVQAQTNLQFAPSTSSRLGAKQCINVQVMAVTSSIYDHFII